MAAKDLKKALEQLSESISKESTGPGRTQINELEAICTVDKDEITNSLVMAYKHYNPKAASDPQILKEKSQVFRKFAGEVVKGWKVEIRNNKAFELEKSSNKIVTFLIGAKTSGGAESLFATTNKVIVENIIPKYNEHFSLGNQEKMTAEKREASAHKSKSQKGSLMDFEAAHGNKFSAFDAQTAIRVNALENTLNIKNLPKSSVDRVQKLKKAFYDEEIEGTANFTINKNGKVESKATVSMSIQTARQNVLEGGPSSAASRAHNKILKENIEELKEQIKNNPNNWGPKAKKSPSVIEGVASTIINTPIKTKLAAKGRLKNRTKYKGIIKGESTPTQKSVRKTETKRVHIKGGGITSSMKVAAASRPKGGEKGKGGAADNKDFANQMRHLLKVKRAINQRLPAEVRRNMGKPALTNRTGRFSNSVHVESMIPAAQTLMVKYSYRLNPYETFENTGKKKWPTGYNPKPLIAKSIRGLALGLTDEKLTIRRS